jgi:Domain of unknown function (DUF222)
MTADSPEASGAPGRNPSSANSGPASTDPVGPGPAGTGAAGTGAAGSGAAGPGVAGMPLAWQDDEIAAFLAATAGDEPPDEEAAFVVDPETGPPVGADFWLGQLPQPVLEEVLAARAEQAARTADPAPRVTPFPEGVIEHDGSGPGGVGFESGSVLDGLAPGPVLVQALEDTWDGGLAGLSDDALAGVMLAARRLESRGAAGMNAAAAELARRREAAGPRIAEHTGSEVAMLLAWTRPAADRLLNAAISLDRLPATTDALWTGRIDRLKADVIVYETGLLDAEVAAAVELLVIEDAPALTTSQLRARVRRAVLAADPAAARRRAQQAAREARVECYGERSGSTAALSGRDLPAAGTLAADQRIDAAARALKAAGVAATLPQLRAAVFLGLLTGADPRTFLPPAPDHGDSLPPAPDHGDSTGEPTSTPVAPGSTPADQAGGTQGGQSDVTPAGSGGHPEPSTDPTTAASSGSPGGSGDDPAGDAGGKWPGPGKVSLRGSVNLTLPLATWLGTGQSPGDIAGFGPATAHTCQDVADWIAECPGTRWCLTLTDKTGRAVGHGCARRPPPVRGDPAALARWLAQLKIEPIEAGTCTHAREVPGYRIPERLHHVVKIRQRTCISPVCIRSAMKCDDDHTVPYDQGGKTCECDLGPACRSCHRVKQAPGWRLDQPKPGVFVWHLPNGRTVTTAPDPYPT